MLQQNKKTSEAELVQISIQKLNLPAQVIADIEKSYKRTVKNHFGLKLEVADKQLPTTMTFTLVILQLTELTLTAYEFGSG